MPSLSTDDRIAQLESTSAILGEYMLRGYTLTDLSCEKCHVTPLMREPASAAAAQDRDPIQFCAQCDGRPESAPFRTALHAPKPEEADDTDDEVEDPNYNARAALYAGAASQTSASAPTSSSSTSNVQGKPSRSADAAESISTLLLQGYALLADNCPQPACRGIPLVGYPRRKDGSKDGRRMCVSCGSAWVDQGATDGLKVMEPSSGSAAPAPGNESPHSKARRELYEAGQKIVVGQKGLEKGKAKEGKEPVFGSKQKEETLAKEPEDPTTPTTKQAVAEVSTGGQAAPRVDSALNAVLSHTSASLTSALDYLATSLDDVPRGPEDQARYFVDLKLHTEAIKDVLGALSLVDRSHH